MKHWKKILLALFVLTIIITPFVVFAIHGNDGLVPCGKTPANSNIPPTGDTVPCSLCHLYVLAQNITNFLTWHAAPLIAVLAFSWGGFKILTAGANPGARQDGMRVLRDTIIGLLIVFLAWVFINEVLLFLTNESDSNGTAKIFNKPWNTVQCIITPSP